jgi:hypothetical protein
MRTFRSVSRTLLFLACLAGLAAVYGCDSEPKGPPGLASEYVLNTVAQGSEITYELDVSQGNGNDVSGDGTLTIEDQDSPEAATFDVSVSGTYRHPSVELEFKQEDGPTSRFAGNVGEQATSIEGTLTFPNGAQQEVTMGSD